MRSVTRAFEGDIKFVLQDILLQQFNEYVFHWKITIEPKSLLVQTCYKIRLLGPEKHNYSLLLKITFQA
jgi:hypothetical protein